MDIENMSDEELMKLGSAPPVIEQEDTPQTDTIEENAAPAGSEDDAPQGETDGLKSEGEDDAGGAEGDDKEVEKPQDEDLSDEQIAAQEAPSFAEDKKPQGEKKEEEPKTEPASDDKKEKDPASAKEEPKVEGQQDKPQEQALDYKAEFEKLVGTPIKANGKDLVLKNTDEVLRLVQQGAGYAQKMEQLKPARKSAAMLESAGLLGNEQALSQMIDLYNGDPKALAKLVKDLKIDIYALDLEAGDTYTPNSHIQSDEAVNFQDTLKEVRTLDGGKEALALIDGMDDQSKQMLWGNSEAVRQLYDYKQNGVYDRVANEVHRRRTLGTIPANLPFIVAFERVGSELAAADAASFSAPAVEVNPNPPVAEPAKPAPRTPIASGPAPRKVDAPDARAAAAASPRSGGGQAKPVIDIFSLSDADIEKMSAPPQ